MQGYGNCEPGCQVPGDLVVEFVVSKHPVFNRDGANITIQQSLSYSEAILGTQKEIILLGGEKKKVQIPPYTPAGHKIVLHGFGLPCEPESSKNGDLVVIVHVDVPDDMSDEELTLIRRLEELRVENLAQKN